MSLDFSSANTISNNRAKQQGPGTLGPGLLGRIGPNLNLSWPPCWGFWALGPGTLCLTMSSPLSFRTILSFYLPLAASWVLMSFEGPVSVRLISMRPDSVTHTAAFLLVMGIALWIESPVIDLLSTATTLATNKARIHALRNFALLMMGFCTCVHVLVTATPLYTMLMNHVLHIRAEVADAARGPLIAMLPWSASIGWRRWQQGVMIRANKTRGIGVGTALRLCTILAVGFTLIATTKLSGVMVTGTTLATSVFLEAMFISIVARPAFAAIESNDDDAEPLTLRDLMRFHLPLSLSTFVGLTSIPLLGAMLGQFQDDKLHMAAWQVSNSVGWSFRAPVFALTEVIIALAVTDQAVRKLRQFSISMGLALCAVNLLIWLGGVDKVIFSRLLGVSPEVLPYASTAFGACTLFPIAFASVCYIRGRLTALHLTMARVYSIVISLATLCVSMVCFRLAGWPGVVAASVSTMLSIMVDFVIQFGFWLRRPKIAVAAAGPDYAVVESDPDPVVGI